MFENIFRNIFRTYPVKVTILEKRGNSIQIFYDKATRIIEKDGTQHYRLKKKKANIPPPEYKYIFVDKKGKPLLFLYSPQQGQYAFMSMKDGKYRALYLKDNPVTHCKKCNEKVELTVKDGFLPMEIENPPNLMIEDKEMTFWNILQTRKTYEIYPRESSFLEKYMPLMVMIIGGATLVFVTIFVMRGLGGIAGSVGSISLQLKEVAEILAGKVYPPGT